MFTGGLSKLIDPVLRFEGSLRECPETAEFKEAVRP